MKLEYKTDRTWFRIASWGANRLVLICGFAAIAVSAFAQTPIPIPPTLSGTTFALIVDESTKQFLSGPITNTYGVNGNYLGPTLIMQAGNTVNMSVTNNLAAETSMHWHGLHVAPEDDGSPHQPIAPGATWSPQFPLLDKAGTYWYHPHMHETTNEQVTKGAAGFIIVQDAEEAALNLPRGYGSDDFPLVLQTKQFNGLNQIVIDWVDTHALINGTVNGLLTVPRQVVRLRLLNANNVRSLNVGFSDNHVFYQIATDGGLINTPKTLTRLLLSPGERAEILVDFLANGGQTIQLMSYGSEMANGVAGGPCGMGAPCNSSVFSAANFNMLQINVATTQTANPVTTVPAALVTVSTPSTSGAPTRTFTFDGPPPWKINGVLFDNNVINFTTNQSLTEIWQLTNNTPWAHPFHVHGNPFFELDANNQPIAERKDVVLVPRNSTLKFVTKFEDFSNATVPYMYHCHLLNHEDDGMMGQFLVNGPPACTNLTSPANGATNVAVTAALTWAAATGSPTGYRLNIGTTPGGTDILNNVDVGNVTTYNPAGDFPYNATIYVKINPYNAGGNASACTETSFNTTVCIPNLTLSNMSIASGTYHSDGELLSSIASIANGAVVVFKSNTAIVLQQDFTVELGGVLDALIETCPVSFGEGNVEEK